MQAIGCQVDARQIILPHESKGSNPLQAVVRDVDVTDAVREGERIDLLDLVVGRVQRLEAQDG